jgi:hypothetical protein
VCICVCAREAVQGDVERARQSHNGEERRVTMRPVSILRSVSIGTPEAADISTMLRGPCAARRP